MRRQPTKRTLITAGVVAAALAGAGAGAGIYAAFGGGQRTVVREVRDATPTGRPAARETTTATLTVNEIYRRAARGVVEISTESTAAGQSPFPNPGSQQSVAGVASGFVYDTKGHIVTNYHVVDGAGSIVVKLSDGSTYRATVVGTDPSTDLAVLHVEAPTSALAPLALGDSASVKVGDGVVAIGTPFGLAETVTAGIVSAVDREISSPNNSPIEGAIQTDAPINHGNSGGPLLSTSGRVIGVNAQIESDSGGNDGVGFAIPSNTVRSVVSQLIAGRRVTHAYLGVAAQTIPGSVASRLGVPQGVAVAQVRAGTGAARAGLHAATGSRSVNGTSYPTGGDVITTLDGRGISTVEELRAAIEARRPGQRVVLTIVRGGHTRRVSVTLGTRSS